MHRRIGGECGERHQQHCSHQNPSLPSFHFLSPGAQVSAAPLPIGASRPKRDQAAGAAAEHSSSERPQSSDDRAAFHVNRGDG